VTDAVRITGLREFQRGLRELDSGLPKALRIAMNSAADVIVADARPRVPQGRTGHARSSVVARSTRGRARVEGGGRRAPYYPWLDFGGTIRPHGHNITRPFIGRTGRYIYNAFFRKREQFTDRLADELAKVAESAGLEVDRG
jgi:hypothetical protein